MRDFFQKAVKNKVVLAIISVIVGLVLIIGKSSAVAAILKVIGVLLLIGGIVLLLSFFFGKQNRGSSSALAGAIICILVSIILIYGPHWLIAFFPFVMGLVLVVNGVFNISALISSPIRTPGFGVGLALSLLTTIFGIIALVQPSAMANVLIVFIGVTFLVNGITDLVAIATVRS